MRNINAHDDVDEREGVPYCSRASFSESRGRGGDKLNKIERTVGVLLRARSKVGCLSVLLYIRVVFGASRYITV